MSGSPAVLMYHYVRPLAECPTAGYSALDLPTFESQLDDIGRHRTPVGWGELVPWLEGRGTLPDDAVVLTFDDGLVDHHRWVLPRLVERGLPALFFPIAREDGAPLTLPHGLHVLIAALGTGTARQAVIDRLAPTDRTRHRALELRRLGVEPDDAEDAWKRPLQRELAVVAAPVVNALVVEHVGPSADIAAATYLSRAHLVDLVSAGMTLGGHATTHPWLDALPVAAARREVSGAAAWLAGLVAGPWPFAYPYGGVPARARSLLEPAGFAAAFTTARQHRGPFRLGRVDADAIGPEPSRLLP